MEKEQLVKANALVADWKQLTAMAVQKKDWDAALFSRVFTETFALLRPISCDTTVDKRLMQMLMQAAAFVDADAGPKHKEYHAAAVMTERLLRLCVVNPTAYIEPVEGATIYLADCKEEVYIDFRDAEGAFRTLMDILA